MIVVLEFGKTPEAISDPSCFFKQNKLVAQATQARTRTADPIRSVVKQASKQTKVTLQILGERGETQGVVEAAGGGWWVGYH